MQIFNINSIPEELLPLVGGKARGLYQLIKFGYDVPEAFVITDTNDDDDFAPVAEMYEKMGFDEVSVRSSATLEDGVDFSAAGQFSTFLNVRGKEQLIQAVKDCQASLHNITAEQYAKTFLRSTESKMNIVVQRMVKAECAGVIFSRAPMRPGFVLVEAVPGLGENLVSGKMSAQQYRVRDNRVENMPANPVLTKKDAIALGNAGKKAEELFGMPMDLEWAIDNNRKIQWLQARPITISESVTMNELDCNLDATDSILTTGNIGEVMPGAVTPLNLSTNMYALDWGVMQTYLEIGCIEKPAAPYSYIASYYNHMFFNMTNMNQITHGAYGSTKESLDVSICGQVLEGYEDKVGKDMPAWKRLRNTFRFIKMVFAGDEAKKGMDKVVTGLKFDLSQDMEGIYKQIIQNFDALKWAQYYHYRASYYSGGQSAMLNNLEKDFEDKNVFRSTVAGCLTQNDEFESANVLKMMRELADLIAEDEPQSKEYTTEQIGEYLTNRASEKVQQALNEFFERHGHRGIREPEIMSLPWRDNRESFYTSLKSILSSLNTEVSLEKKAWTDYANDILSHYSGFKRKMVNGFINKARKGVCYREYTKSKTILVLDQFKQAYRKLAQLMVEKSLLPDEECIYFLLQEEVGQLLAGDQSLVKKAMARRRLYPQQQNMKFPYVQMGIPMPISDIQTDANTTLFQGTPVSRGIASGIARIVNSEEDAAQLQKGEIMVAACTDIGWTPFYNTISGLVTEIGSALSHGVVVAREYALPTVVNASNIMHLIHTGDHITVDGNTGKVIINEKKA